MNTIVQTVGVVVLKENKVLLVKSGEGSGHITGTYGLPSGRIDFGETATDAAARELQEETGLFVNQKDLVEFPENKFKATIPRKDSPPVTFSWQVFFAKNTTGQLKISDETIPEWVVIDQLDLFNLLPNTKVAITKAHKYFSRY